MRRVLPALIALALAATLPGSATAQTQDAPTVNRIMIEPQAGTIIRLEGHYPQTPGLCPSKQRRPLMAKYRDRLELRVGSNGRIEMVNGLTFSNYLRGIAEVPTSWPMDALRAQVIAARSYALATMRSESAAAQRRGYDICATDRCQVYRGATVELGAFGDRWVEAVESTKGEVMRHRGTVITAFYFSTSTGTTRKSFFSRTEGPAWLDSVPGMDEDAPLARWTAPVRLDDLAPILRAAGRWGGGRINRVSHQGDTVTITGASGTVRLSRSAFRGAINSEGPCLFPERYPNSSGSQTGGRLPLSVPSSTYNVSQDGRRIVIRGRGWGHDVGMSQYGARALADRGWRYPRILNHYYNHDELATITEPEEIRVLAAEGMQRVRFALEGPAHVTTGTGSELASGNEFEVRVADGRLRLLRGRGPTLTSVTTVTPRRAQVEATVGDASVPVRFDLSRSARVTIELADASGAIVSRTEEESFVSGDGRARVPLRDANGEPLPAGEYTATVVADDGLDVIRSEPVMILVAAPAAEEPPPGRDTGDEPGAADGSRALPVVLAGLLLAAAGGLWFAVRRRLYARG